MSELERCPQCGTSLQTIGNDGLLVCPACDANVIRASRRPPGRLFSDEEARAIVHATATFATSPTHRPVPSARLNHRQLVLAWQLMNDRASVLQAWLDDDLAEAPDLWKRELWRYELTEIQEAKEVLSALYGGPIYPGTRWEHEGTES